ncbi:metal ABC transporter permease [Limoniibacter endophyticus]|uniref:Membrane protein n=1 Tax=Limoniibacter endophyticus TaxID=1565040 RepID=A0A8J3GHP2_9HYPH|nr:metal ABC transporter permease [Limoniibacter endophyticus]GHC80399.1 membrane protein [Limoniibacter endophyticus]
MSVFLADPWLPFDLPFMQQAFLMALLVSLPLALLSCFLVLKGWALMGDAISHGVLPGIVIAYMVGLPLAVGAFLAGLFCAISTGYLRENSRVKEDTVLGVVFSGMFGLGVVLYTWVKPDVHLDHILFGDILGLVWGDVLESAVMAAIVFGTVGLFWRTFMAHGFDAQHARAIGLPVRLLHYGLLAVLSLAVVGALKGVGIILAVALLIMPGSIALLLTRRFGAMLLTAMAIAGFCAILGIYLSFYIDSAPAPTIVLCMTICFIFSLLFYRLQMARIQKQIAVSS